jgi:hypothetical protein
MIEHQILVKTVKQIRCFVWFYGASTQFRSYGAETGKMIMASLGCYKFDATPGVKTSPPAGAKRCTDFQIFEPI